MNGLPENRRRRNLIEVISFVGICALAIAGDLLEPRLAFWAGQGKLSPSVLWSGWGWIPIPAITYVLAVWSLHLETVRVELTLAKRLTAIGVLLAITVLGRRSIHERESQFLSGFAANLQGKTLQSVENSLRSLAEDDKFRDSKMTEFVSPTPELLAVLRALYPKGHFVLTVLPVTENEKAARVSWGGHTFMWGIIYGPPDIFAARQIRQITPKTAIFIN